MRPPPQRSLFDADPPVMDRAQGDQLKAEGIARVDEHAGGDFQELALLSVRAVAFARPMLTSDDVWVHLGRSATTHDNRAMGPVMRRAQALGVIEPTERFVLTAQARRHRAPVRVWRSLLK